MKMSKVIEKKVAKPKFFKGVKTELKKVVWPTKKELVSYTGVVVFTCIAFSLAIWAFDTIFNGALKLVFNF